MAQPHWPPSRSFSVPAAPFQVTSSDGVRLRGHRVGAGGTAVVFCHGFTGWHRKPRLVRFQEELAQWFVFAFDFRGHGASRGVSTFGALEFLDVDAVAARARSEGFDHVVTFGGSMGGIAVIRHAALVGGVDGVVAVSTPSRWQGHDTHALRRMQWFTTTGAGRLLLRGQSVRITPSWGGCEDQVDLVGRIAPTPLVIVHGRDDHFFPEEQARQLYQRAGDPKRLVLASPFGHAEDGYTPAFARRVALAVRQMVPG
jgi:pimeloyl-ACP methyl ester carboxylesterase